MKRLKIISKAIAVITVASITLSLAACGGSSVTEEKTAATENTMATTTTKVETTKVKTPIELTISTADPFTSAAPGIQDNAVANYIKDKFGITMNIISCDPEKTKVLLAGGDLPDIMILKPEQGKIALKSKLALPLNSLLQSKGQNILKNKLSLDAINKRLDNKDGEYYMLPIMVEPKSKPAIAYSPWIGWYTRWDYYKELGYPELNSYDDMIPMLAKEQKMHPKTDEGKKVYGLSGWNDWGLWSYHVPFIYAEGWVELTKNTCVDPNGKYVHRYAADGPLWRGVNFYYKANKAGILDEECFTQKHGDYLTKLNAGQLLTCHAGWLIPDANKYFISKNQLDKGFVAQVVNGATSMVYSVGGSIIGTNDPWNIITSSCKNPERAMEFLDYMRTIEGSRLIVSGVKGVHWDYLEGKPQMKDEVRKQSIEKNFAAETGIGLYIALMGLGKGAYDDKETYIDLTLTPEYIKATMAAPIQVDLDFSKHYGATYPGEAWDKLVNEGKAKRLNPYSVPELASLQPQGGDDISKMEGNIEEILKKELPKAILAKSDSDFENQKKRILGLMDKAGFAKVDAFWKDSLQKGLTEYESLTGKTIIK